MRKQMKINDIITNEWRKSPYDPSTNPIDFESKLKNSVFVTNINIGSLSDDEEQIDHGSLDIVRYDYDSNNRLYMLVWTPSDFQTWQPPILARLLLEKVDSNVWQIKEIAGTSNFPIKNLGFRLLKNVLIIEHLNIINDFDMSASAENLWMNKMSDRVRGIYDKKLGTVYPLSKVGSLTDDGVEIIHPKDDIGDSDDYSGESQRFFIILENHHRSDLITEVVGLKRSYRRKTIVGESISLDERKWSRADIVVRLFER